MYGMVNKAVEAMVRSSYSDATWQTIRQQAEVSDCDLIILGTHGRRGAS